MTSNQRDEFVETFDRLFAGTLARESAAQFARRLATDADARALYVELVALHFDLEWLCGRLTRNTGTADLAKVASWEMDVEPPYGASEPEVADPGNGLMATTPADASKPSAPLLMADKRINDSSRQSSRTSSLGFLGMAIDLSTTWLSSPRVLALTIVGCLGTYFLGLMISIAISRAFLADRQAQERAEPQAAASARIIAESGCRWQDRAPKTDLGAKLPTGTSCLVEGVVELEFDGGARVSIEAPAEFSAQSGRRIQLARGRLVAYVPKPARGFTVDTPSAEVIDLGTEFGVEVDGQGGTDLQVIRGRVELKPAASTVAQPATAQRISAGSAVRVSPGRPFAEPIAYSAARFDTVRLDPTNRRRPAKGAAPAIESDPIPIALEKAWATFSQADQNSSEAIDAVTTDHNGWAIHPREGADQAISFETASPSTQGGKLTFELVQNFGYGFNQNLGRFRLSATTDGGATWQTLRPLSVTDLAGSTFTVLDDESILVSGTNPWGAETYTVVAETALMGINGFRLEALADPSLPFDGPGRNPGDGNFVLTEFRVKIAYRAESAPPHGAPADSVRADGVNAAPRSGFPP